MIVGARLYELRRKAGLSQRELAAKAGLSVAYVSRIESGDRSPSMTALIALAEVLGTTALILLTGDPEIVCPVCLRHPHG